MYLFAAAKVEQILGLRNQRFFRNLFSTRCLYGYPAVHDRRKEAIIRGAAFWGCSHTRSAPVAKDRVNISVIRNVACVPAEIAMPGSECNPKVITGHDREGKEAEAISNFLGHKSREARKQHCADQQQRCLFIGRAPAQTEKG